MTGRPIRLARCQRCGGIMAARWAVMVRHAWVHRLARLLVILLRYAARGHRPEEGPQ